MQPPPELEDEFNAWYDTEHLAERLAVPGFETARRFVCIDGAPRYLAMYDLTTPEVLESPEYLRVGYDNASPWTKRVTSRVRIYRSAGKQVYPGFAVTTVSARVLLMRFRSLQVSDEAAIVEGMRKCFESRGEVTQVRVLAFDTGTGIDYLGFVEMNAPMAEPVHRSPFGSHARMIDLVNTYATYT
jgi:hypothetical protein